MLFVGLPTYGHSRVNTLAIIDLQETLGVSQVYLQESSSSLLSAGFNKLWTSALNLRKTKQITSFLLLHSDVIPLGHGWIRVLLDEMERTEAKVLSLILPVKDARGLVSTAIDDGTWMPKGFTTAQVQMMPETFTHPDLLVNSGCLLVDFREDWVEQICFTVRDRIVKNEKGQFMVECESEDYGFSRQCRKLGVPVFATRKVKAHHEGHFRYPNYEAWGS